MNKKTLFSKLPTNPVSPDNFRVRGRQALAGCVASPRSRKPASTKTGFVNRLFSRTSLLCLAVFALSGCALLDPGPPMSQVILPVRIDVAAKSDRMPFQVLVSQPVAAAATGSDRIMALMNGYEVRALNSAKWVAPVPGMVQRLLIDSLEATRRLQAVGWEESAPDANIRLTTDVRRFYLRYEKPGANPVAEIALILSLVDMDSAKILSRRQIAVEQPCAGSSIQEFVAAFSMGMTKVLRQADEWVIATLEKEAPKKENAKP